MLVGKAYYGCANYKNRGTCGNTLSMRMDMLERTVLAGLKDRPLTPDLVADVRARVPAGVQPPAG